jgi:hypothetical protein
MGRVDKIYKEQKPEMAVNYLDSPIAVVAGFALGLLIMVFWLLIDPLTRGKHKTAALYLDIMFTIEAATIPIFLIAQAPWKQPILSNLWYNFIMTRVSTNPTTAHATAYVGIALSYFIFQRMFYSNWKSFLTVAILAFTHEGLWFVYAVPFGVTHSLWADLNYMAFLSMTLLTYHIKYKLNWKYLVYFVFPVFAYTSVWALVGFPITVTSSEAMTMYPTSLWSDMTTNAIEVFSWLYAIGFASVWAYTVRDTGPRPPKLKFVVKRQW